MSHLTAQVDIIVDDPQPAKTKLATFFTTAYNYIIMSQCVPTVASTAIRGGLVAPLRQLWVHYYGRVVFVGEGVVMPHSALCFITNAIIALAAIKSQFLTHPLSIMLSVNCLLVYGLASAAELVVSCARLDPTSVYAVTAHLGKIVSLCILVASLASLFYM